MGDIRSTVRFPLRLPVSVKVDAGQTPAETTDISAGGVLFYVDKEMAVGSAIDFSITMPAQVLGSSGDISVACSGRVVRSFMDGERRAVAAVIDDYRFLRANAHAEGGGLR